MGDRIFTQIFEDFFSGWLKTNPSTASWLGFHEYDGQVEDLSPVSIERELQRLKRFQGQLQQLQPSTLSPAARFDYHELLWEIEIESEIFDLEELRDWERNPIVYAQLFGISNYIKRNYAPLDGRGRRLHPSVVPPLDDDGVAGLDHVLRNDGEVLYVGHDALEDAFGHGLWPDVWIAVGIEEVLGFSPLDLGVEGAKYCR